MDTFAQKYHLEYSASFTPNLDTVYLFIDDGIYTSRKVDNVWQTPERLNNNVYGSIIRNPSISKDGKRIYYSGWGGFGSWDLWYNDWDDSLNDWGPVMNMGSAINSPSVEWYLYEVSRDTIYTLNDNWGTNAPGLYVFDHARNEWACVDSFYYHPLGAGNLEGMSITGNRKKLYFSRWSGLWTDHEKKSTELCVSYWDTSINNWGDPFFLNINSEASQPDTSKNIWIGGGEIDPWISPDGKTLIFASNRDEVDRGDGGLYVSHLLIDENGDTTDVEVSPHRNTTKEYRLYPNYPNPFNPATAIRLDLSKESEISLTVYDMRGRRVRTLFEGRLVAGAHQIVWNAQDDLGQKVSSGVYFCKMEADKHRAVRKMILMK